MMEWDRKHAVETVDKYWQQLLLCDWETQSSVILNYA